MLNKLIEQITQNATNTGWEENWNDYEKVALCHSELSEAIEELRNGHKPAEIYFNKGNTKPEGFPIELADTVIRIMHICGHHKIDLESAILQKLEYNKTRPYRHGNKLA